MLPRVSTTGLCGLQGRSTSPTQGLTAIRSRRSRSRLCRACPQCSRRSRGRAEVLPLGLGHRREPARPGSLSFSFCGGERHLGPGLTVLCASRVPEGEGRPDQEGTRGGAGAGAGRTRAGPHQCPVAGSCVGPQHPQHGLQGHPERPPPTLTKEQRGRQVGCWQGQHAQLPADTVWDGNVP